MLTFQTRDKGYQTESTLYEKNYETQFPTNQMMKLKKKISIIQKKSKKNNN